VEQSIGRGLRLPYGKRTGQAIVDRLTIVAHDKFQEIVDYANSPDSIIRGGMKVFYIEDERSQVVVVEPEMIKRIDDGTVTTIAGAMQRKIVFDNPQEKKIAKATLEVIRDFERLPRSADLNKPEIRKQIIEKVQEFVAPDQRQLEGISEKMDVAGIVDKTIALRNEFSIDIPRITIQPVGEVSRGYNDFNLDISKHRLQPVDSELLIQALQRREQYRLLSGDGIIPEEKPEDYIVRGLIEFDDICYDDHAKLLYKLAGQVVTHLRSYLKDEAEVLNVLQYHQKSLVNLVHAQMQDHYTENAVAYEAVPSKGFIMLRPNYYSVPVGEAARDFRVPIADKLNIRKMVFSGFKKSLFSIQKFDSDSERRFAAILENDRDVLKWFKPGNKFFQIFFASDSSYEPDFVAETKTCKFLCEPKAANEMETEEVKKKARAAVEWCKNASIYEEKHGGKPWRYLLIPHDEIAENKTLQGLAEFFMYNEH
jgi:type III restriction enzyme